LFSSAYPVDLVKVVRLQNVGTDDTSTVGGSHLNVDMAEEDIEVALDGGSVSLLRDGELGTEIGALDGTGGGVPLGKGR
jgi:hypothetical protein